MAARSRSRRAHRLSPSVGPLADVKKLKDQHWARTRDPHGAGAKKSRTAADGLIDSDSEDEKVVQATKRKAAPVENSKPLTGGPVKPKIVAPPQKKAKSAA